MSIMRNIANNAIFCQAKALTITIKTCNHAVIPAKMEKMMDDKIMGYTFEEIRVAQQVGRLGRVIDVSKPAPVDPDRERADVKLLQDLGEAKLRELGYMGVIDRLERGGYLMAPG